MCRQSRGASPYAARNRRLKWVAEPPAPRDPDADRYTYVFEGNSQVLDNILLSAPLIRGGYGYDVVHVNAEFADQVSDHDPQVVRLVVR